MSSLLSVELLIGILAGLMFGMVVVLLLQLRSSVIVNRLAAPAYEFVEQQAKREAKKIVEAAEAEAKQILDEVKGEREHILASYDARAEELRTTFEQQFNQHSNELHTRIDATIEDQTNQFKTLSEDTTKALQEERDAIKDTFKQLVEELQKAQQEVSASALGTTRTVEGQISKTASVLEKQMHTYDSDIKGNITAHVERALKSADKAAEAYKESREKMLDRHMAEIVEAVTKRVLHKQLTITEHAELVRDALQRAKRDGII
jgi:gas vesicle protein